VLFGAVAQRTNFCTMGAVSDMVNLGDTRRWRAWLLAMATAVILSQWLSRSGVVDLDRSMYLTANLSLGGHILGGLLMGVGMVLAGGCPSRTLVRAGTGDLKALFTLIVIGIVGYAAIGGVLGVPRATFDAWTQIPLGRFGMPTQSLGDIIAVLTAWPQWLARAGVTALVAGAVLVYCFADAGFRASSRDIAAGLGVGGAVALGWAVTGLAFDELATTPMTPQSLSYVRPAGDALEWIERATAYGWPGFGPSTVFGALLGAGLAGWSHGQIRLATFRAPGDTLMMMAGAALMGLGGVMALGCTVGQGVTGASTLALGAFITFAANVAGARLGFKLLERLI
jgi:hypothetical protein